MQFLRYFHAKIAGSAINLLTISAMLKGYVPACAGKATGPNRIFVISQYFSL
jgi:hypothetical protein